MAGFRRSTDASKRAIRTRRAVAPHPLTAELATEIRGWQWPKGAGKTAYVAIDQSLKAYDAWRLDLEALPLTSNKGDSIAQFKKVMRFRDYVLEILPSSKQLVNAHFATLFRTVARRHQFRGDLRPYAWRPRCHEWATVCSEWAGEWCSNPGLWEHLLQAMENARK